VLPPGFIVHREASFPLTPFARILKAPVSLFFFCACLWTAPPAGAHFQLNANIRIVHVEHLADGANLYMRLPTPYVLAPLLGEQRANAGRRAAPYTYNRMEDGQLMHYIDHAALQKDSPGLGQLVAVGHRLVADGATVSAEVEKVQLHPAHSQPPFATLAEAKAALVAPSTLSPKREIFVGDTVTDVMLRYRTDGALSSYALSSTLNPGLAGQEQTANLVLDHFPGGTKIFRATGLLHEPIQVSRSALAAAWTFIVEGGVHILNGMDHVLFVICLVIGATTIGGLLWKVTGFTLGHSITLAVGFFGLAPQAAWFVPAVEAGISLSIIYAAMAALARREMRSSFFVTTAIGLLHGLGFSFVLREILQINAPNLWQSLLAFNFGVELGQIAIVLLIWPLLHLIQKRKPTLSQPLRWLIAAPCIAFAGVWTGQRVVLFFNAV